MRRVIWSYEETLVAFNLYCRTPFGRLHARNPEIISVAANLGRTPGALAMKCCNLAALDPALSARGISGLQKVSTVDRQVWADFEAMPESVAMDSVSAYEKRLRTFPPELAEQAAADPAQTERWAIGKQRIGQRLFREMILVGYGAKCAVCSLPVPELLVASHIVPWSVDPILRMNPRNGLCLCAIHDRAFDCGLMVISERYEVGFTARIEEVKFDAAVRRLLTDYDQVQLRLPERWVPSVDLLARHRAFHS